MTEFRKGILLGASAVLLAAIAVATVIATAGLYDVAADNPDSGLTRGLIAYVRERSITAHAGDIKAPPLSGAKMLAEGAEHYDAMCTGCHLAPGLRENEMRPGMNPKPPILTQIPAGDPARQFWIIKHGIKMTAMPAWGPTHSDEEIWSMVALLQKLPTLSPQAYRKLVAASGEHHDMDMGH